MSFILRCLNSLKNNGLSGSWRIFKNYLRIRKFSKKHGDNNGLVPDDDGFTGYSAYDCEYQNNIDFSDRSSDVKPLAFFLPQFHTTPENDEWWGKGFTEWTNTSKSLPRFCGHYQPREPHDDIGYYDLSNINVLKRQATLAKSHGIYGFCFYHYWFSGKRLLKKPVDMLLQHPEIDINFCLCWANENWTKVWDGQQSNILAQQNYAAGDAERFIDDLSVYIKDDRYIKIDSKPVIVIYNCGDIPNVKKTFENMRHRAKQIGIGEILIWACRTHDSTAQTLKISDYIDAEVEFPPHNTNFDCLRTSCIKLKERASIYNYQKLVKFITGKYSEEQCDKPVYRTVMTAWDNSCRRQENYTVYYAYSIKSFYNWVKAAVRDARKNHPENSRFIFVNAFNEWAEGTYLEPDKKYGYSNINTFSKALFGLDLIKPAITLKGSQPDISAAPKIAVQAHIFHVDVMGKIIQQLNCIPYEFDCFISTDTAQKQQFIKNSFAQKCKCSNITVEVFENRGRDVLPFVLQMQSRFKNYDLICHIHSKKTVKSDYGESWRDYLYSNLLGCEQNVASIINLFLQNPNLGVVFPKTYPPLESQAVWGNNRRQTEQLLQRMDIPPATADDVVFPVGNMFWARSKAIANIFSCSLSANDFPAEKGQLNSTIAHAIERSWVFIAAFNGYTYEQTISYTEDN